MKNSIVIHHLSHWHYPHDLIIPYFHSPRYRLQISNYLISSVFVILSSILSGCSFIFSITPFPRGRQPASDFRLIYIRLRIEDSITKTEEIK